MYSTRRYRPSMSTVPNLDDPSGRLKWAREKAQFKTASDAARRFHWNENTYRSHENGTRDISRKAANKYAKAFKIENGGGWILYGEGSVPPLDPELISLWDNLTPGQQAHLKRYIRMLLEEDHAA